jgi:ankyrin repeat protein
MTGNNRLIPGGADASMLEKTADFLLIGPRALFMPKISGVYNGKSVQALCRSDHRLILSRQNNIYNGGFDGFAFVGRIAAFVLSPVLIVPLGIAAAVGLKLKSAALKKPDAKLYNSISTTYLRFEQLNKQMGCRRKISDAQIQQHHKLMAELNTQGEAYWDVAKTKKGPKLEPLPLFELEIDKRTNPLHLAIQRGDTSRALELIQKKEFNLNETSESGYTALHLAVMKGNIAIIREIVKQNPHTLKKEDCKKGLHPLHTALLHGKEKAARELVSLGADVNATTRVDHHTPLHYAIKNKNKNMVDLLLNNGAAPSVNKKNNAGINPMTMALSARNMIIAAQLIPHADLSVLDTNRNNCLNLAVQTGSFEMVKMVYTNMTPLNLNPHPCYYQNSKGDTPLHDAINLLERPLYRNEKSRKENIVQIVKFLIANGAPRFGQNTQGQMPVDLIVDPETSLKKEIRELLTH